jgi:hypothetical protein
VWLRRQLGLDPKVKTSLALALGKPVDDVRIIDVPEDGGIRYWCGEGGTHYEPNAPFPN